MSERIMVAATEYEDWISEIEGQTAEFAMSYLTRVLVKYGKDARLETEQDYDSPTIGKITYSRPETDNEYNARLAKQERARIKRIDNEAKKIAMADHQARLAAERTIKNEAEERELLATLLKKYGTGEKS